MCRGAAKDQKDIWTSPFHTAKSDIRLWVVFGGATAALIATDSRTVKELPNSSTQISGSTWGSRFGSAYSLTSVPRSMGTATHDDRFRETGLLAFETLIDSNLAVEAVKIAADRARPYQTDGSGHFEAGPTRWSSGFPFGPCQ